MTVSDLYGFAHRDAQHARSQIEALIGTSLKLHDSSYVSNGEYLTAPLPSGGTIALHMNYDEAEQEWAEDDFRDYPLLVYVDSGPQCDEWKAKLLGRLAGLHFLQREVCTTDRRFIRIRHQNGRDVVVMEKALPTR